MIWAAIVQAACSTTLAMPVTPCTPWQSGSFEGFQASSTPVKVPEPNGSHISKRAAKKLHEQDFIARKEAERVPRS